MRAFLLVVALSGCTDTVLDENTSFRRLRDDFASEAQCLEQGDFTPCFQTLLLCADGRTVLDLENSPQRGTYQLEGNVAVAAFVTRTFNFDIATRSSDELPGRHPWEQIEPLFSSCD